MNELDRIKRTKLKDLATMSRYEEDHGQIDIIRPREIVFLIAIGPIIAITILFIVAHARQIDQFITTMLNKILV